MDGPFSRHTRFGLRLAKTTVDLSGSMTLPFPNVPCSQTPPQSPVTIEPPRDSRRLHHLRGLNDGKASSIFTRGSGASGTAVPGARARTSVALGGDAVDCREDRLHDADTEHVGS